MQPVNKTNFPISSVLVIPVLRPSKEDDYNFDVQLEEVWT